MTEPTKPVQIPPARIAIQFPYHSGIILPYEEATQLLALLAKSETYKKDWDKDPEIKPFQDEIQLTYVSEVEYNRLRLSFLRND